MINCLRSMAVRQLAKSFSNRKCWEKAIKYWGRLCEIDERIGSSLKSDDMHQLNEARFKYAGQLCLIGEFESAESLLQQSLSHNPEDIPVLTLVADLYSARNNWEIAIQKWEKVHEVCERTGSEIDEKVHIRLRAAKLKFIEQLNLNGDKDSALSLLAKMRIENPDDIPVLVKIAEIYYSRKEWKEAMDRWREVCEAAEKNSLPLPSKAAIRLRSSTFKLASQLSVSGDHDTAETILKRMRASSPDDIELEAQLAELSTTHGVWDKAVERWGRVCIFGKRNDSKPPEKAPARLRSAQLMYIEQLTEKLDFSKAENFLKSILTDDVDDIENLIHFADLSTRARDWKTAIDRWERVVAIAKQNCEPVPAKAHTQLRAVRITYANKLHSDGNNDAAEAVLKHLLFEYPDDTEVLFQLADISYSSGEWRRAISRWKLVCEIAQKNNSPILTKATMRLVNAQLKYVSQLRQMGDSITSEKVLEEVLAEDTDDIAVLIQIAEYFSSQNDWQEAINRWTKVYNVSETLDIPIPLKAQLRLKTAKIKHAWALNQNGNHDAAKALFQQMLMDDDSDVDIWLQLAELAYSHQDWSKATNLWEQVRSIYEKTSAALPSKTLSRLRNSKLKDAAMRIETGDFNVARTILDQMIAEDQDDVAAWTQLAELSYSLEEWGASAKCWKKVCEIGEKTAEKIPDKAPIRLRDAKLKHAIERVEKNNNVSSKYLHNDRITVLIGGSPSSGTSVLLVRLASYDWALGISESGLFSHRGIYLNYDQFAHNYTGMIESGIFKTLDEGERIRKGLSPHLLANSTRLNAHGLELKDILRFVAKSDSGKTYVEGLNTLFLASSGIDYRVLFEKTPSNIYAMPSFLDDSPNRRGVVIVRNPIDLVSSLISRGLPLFRAMAMWTVESAMALVVREKRGGMVIKYEDLVANPGQVESDIISEIGMTTDSSSRETSQFIDNWPTSWRASPVKDVVSVSVGRGKTEFDTIDRTIFADLRLVDYPSIELENIIGQTAQEIAESLGYSIMPRNRPNKQRIQSRYNQLISRSLATDPIIGRSNFYDKLFQI